MKRATASVDRTSTAVVGLALIALGGGAVAWERGQFPGRERLDAPFLATAVDAGWWPWALGAAAIVLVLLGLWWLLAHLPRRSVGTVAFASTAARQARIDTTWLLNLYIRRAFANRPPTTTDSRSLSMAHTERGGVSLLYTGILMSSVPSLGTRFTVGMQYVIVCARFLVRLDCAPPWLTSSSNRAIECHQSAAWNLTDYARLQQL